MILILILCHILDCFNCEPINCQNVVKPNGEYVGLSIYRRFLATDIQLKMFSPGGFEWEFHINSNGIIVPDMEYLNPVESVIIQKFGVFGNLGEGPFNCIARAYKDNSRKTSCYDVNGFEVKTDLTTDFSDSVITSLKTQNEKENQFVYVINRFDKSNVFAYDVLNSKTDPCGEPSKCEVPDFVGQISAELFAQIEGVVPFQIHSKAAFLILFNINGRPLYCLAFELGIISEECKSSSNMKTLFDECFAEQQPTTSMAKTSMTALNNTEIPETVSTTTVKETPTETPIETPTETPIETQTETVTIVSNTLTTELIQESDDNIPIDLTVWIILISFIVFVVAIILLILITGILTKKRKTQKQLNQRKNSEKNSNSKEIITLAESF